MITGHYCICKLYQYGKGIPLSKQIVKLIVKIQKIVFYSDTTNNRLLNGFILV